MSIFKNGASAELPAGALFLCKEKRVSVNSFLGNFGADTRFLMSE